MSLDVTVLGSAAMFATRQRACSGYLLRLAQNHLWLDAGAGTWRNLLAHVDYEQLDGIILSHRHIDHTSDVFQAFHARRHGGPEPLPPIPLWAPEETLERLTAYVHDLDESFDLRPIRAGDDLEVLGARLSFTAMAHWADTVGVRVELAGGVLAYSSDTGLEADISGLARGADLFLCEATMQDADPRSEGHLKASEAAGIAAEAGVERLVLTHLPPGRDLGLSLAEAHKHSGGITVELADDGKRYEVAT